MVDQSSLDQFSSTGWLHDIRANHAAVVEYKNAANVSTGAADQCVCLIASSVPGAERLRAVWCERI